MNFQKNGITLSVGDDELRRLVLERLSVYPVESADILIDPPPCIGAQWSAMGGIYAGIARGRDGKPDYHLIVGPEYETAIDWQKATEWAAAVTVDGFTDFALPTRKEQALCFANVPELFKEASYWSCEQSASGSGNAWFQYFGDGSQISWGKRTQLRARAVRRLPIG